MSDYAVALEKVVMERNALRAEVETLRRERDEARAWQLSVAELTGYINRAEGQAGYEIADAGTIAHALNSTKGDARAYSETLAYLSKVGAQGHDVDGDAQQGIASLAEQRDEAERALAASQAHAAQLRKALVSVVNMAEFAALCDGGCQPGIDKHTSACREAKARAALALPSDDSALRALVTRAVGAGAASCGGGKTQSTEAEAELSRKELERWNWEQSATHRSRERDEARAEVARLQDLHTRCAAFDDQPGPSCVTLAAEVARLRMTLEKIEARCARISEETLEVFQLRHEIREVRLAAHSALAVAPAALADTSDDWLRALVTRACEMQREACANVVYDTEPGVSVSEVYGEVAAASLVVEDALGKAGE